MNFYKLKSLCTRQFLISLFLENKSIDMFLHIHVGGFPQSYPFQLSINLEISYLLSNEKEQKSICQDLSLLLVQMLHDIATCSTSSIHYFDHSFTSIYLSAILPPVKFNYSPVPLINRYAFLLLVVLQLLACTNMHDIATRNKSNIHYSDHFFYQYSFSKQFILL